MFAQLVQWQPGLRALTSGVHSLFSLWKPFPEAPIGRSLPETPLQVCTLPAPAPLQGKGRCGALLAAKCASLKLSVRPEG